MASQMILLDECLPMDALKLGCLVESIKDPILDAYMPANPLPPDAIATMPAKSFQSLASSSDSSSFRLALTRLAGASRMSENGSKTSLQAIKVNRYILRQPKMLFREMCLGDEKARRWLNDGIQANSRSYFVVELQTAQDATIIRDDAKKKSMDADITVPISTIATGGADVVGAGALLDTGLEAGREVFSGANKRVSFEGENIFAVGYKKVLWRSWGLRRKDVEQAMLDKEITWSLLGQRRSREDEEETVAVDLADDLRAQTNSKAREESPSDGDEEEAEDDDPGEIEELLENGIEIGDQTFLF